MGNSESGNTHKNLSMQKILLVMAFTLLVYTAHSTNYYVHPVIGKDANTGMPDMGAIEIEK
ncbi:hypothetical protein DDZ16_05085 [Marinilabilia rubra]|uniref:Uncharacterized protein n=1 Tax=Marinilabilia rubra TaxID=2162893 RepID=A0A2U2BB77_9BACT|nr:hypothetical protein DDZ16_05085 [Marinilabilia rubra]